MLDLYKNIRKLRLENGWSQNELARRAGYKDRSAIAHVEDGTVDLPQSKIMLFADIFGVSPAQLFGSSSTYELNDDTYTSEEKSLIKAYRSCSPELQSAVCTILGVKTETHEAREDAASSSSRAG